MLDARGRVPLTTLVEALRAHGWDDLRGGEVEEVVRLERPGPVVRPPVGTG